VPRRGCPKTPSRGLGHNSLHGKASCPSAAPFLTPATTRLSVLLLTHISSPAAQHLDLDLAREPRRSTSCPRNIRLTVQGYPGIEADVCPATNRYLLQTSSAPQPCSTMELPSAILNAITHAPLRVTQPSTAPRTG
jgi:hypothetical protein